MSSFSAEFPIDPKKSVVEVVQLACDWIASRLHSKVATPDIHQLPMNDERIDTAGSERITVAKASLGDTAIAGARFERPKGRQVWTNSVVALKTPEKVLVSIQVRSEALNATDHLRPPPKPYFIREALSKLGGGFDGELQVTGRAIRLAPEEASGAARLIAGLARNTLPIVYVTADSENSYMCNPDELASLLSGMAHVVVGPNPVFSREVKLLTKRHDFFSSILHDGAVGIYWPSLNSKQATPWKLYGFGVPSQEIVNDVTVALSLFTKRSNCNWSFLKETISRARIERLKASGSSNVQEYIEAFESERVGNLQRIDELEQESRRLQAEIRRLSASQRSTKGGLIEQGSERDLYEHEIRDIIVGALQAAARDAGPDTRLEHVLQDLLAANPSSGTRERLAGNIKAVLRDYRCMTRDTRDALINMGFTLSSGGAHHKLVYQDDERYTFTLPKTGSDRRGGLNSASDIVRKLFSGRDGEI